MELSIETADSFAIKAMTRTSKNFISYGMMAILIVASVLAFLVLRMNVLLAYLGYVFVTLLYLMHGDGVAFQFLWPNFPRFNSYFSITVGTAFVMATYCFAIVFLQTRTYHPAIHRVLLALFWLTPLITIPGALIDPQWTKRAIFVLVFVGIFAGACVGLKAAMTRFRDVRFFLFAWVCGILSAGLMNMRHIFGLDIAQDTVFDSIRVAIVVDAIMMGLGVADRYSQILRSRQRATEQNLIDAQRNLKLNTRLMSLEEQYQLAVEMVASRDKSLKDTVHDLKQPLHALRLNLQSSKDGTAQGPQQDYNVDEAFSYLETLIANHLRQSIGESETLVTPPEHPSDEDELDLPKVLQSIYEMFEKDASDKGLEFRFVKTRQRTNIEPLVLMRIVTNLVSNAVKYTPSGKVLLGARKNKNSLRIEVHDTGLGLTQAEFKNAQTRHKRLHHDQVDVQGQGLGLSIASELAKTHGLELYIMPGRKNGTSLILEVPK